MRRVRVGSIDVAYDAAGSGQPVILAHPAYLSRAVWERNFDALAARFAVTAVDLPGHGDTNGETDELAGFCDGLCAALGIESAHWVGASWGGRIAVLAAARTRRVRSLVLVAPAVVARARAEIQDAWETFQATFEDRSLATRERFDRYTALQRRALAFMRRHRRGGADLGAVRVPTLIVWGACDRLLPVSSALRVQAGIPGSRLLIYERSNHFPFLDEPERFNRDVIDFISGRSTVEAGS